MEWNRLVPELLVADYPRAKAFYCEVLGFALCFERAESGFGYLDLDGAQIMLLQEPGALVYGLQPGEAKGRGLHLQIELDDLAPLLAHLERAGVELAQALEEVWYRGGEVEYGHREFFVRDADGYLLRFFEDIGERSVAT